MRGRGSHSFIMQWSTEQQAAIEAVRDWVERRDRQVFRLFGYAGTGKTTLAKELASPYSGRVLFGAYTGKAAHVLQKRGCPARTIHSLIYLPKSRATARLEELEKQMASAEADGNVPRQRELTELIALEQEALKRPAFTLNAESEVRDANLVVIDEVSMVGRRMGEDLLSFGTPVLVLGDPAQLPPVMDGGYFTEQDPDVLLTQVHRHAGPVLELATMVREGQTVPGDWSSGASRVLPRGGVSTTDAMNFDIVIVGRNSTRRRINRSMRSLLGHHGPLPEPGDALICTKNNHELELLNGSLWKVLQVGVLDQDRIILDLVSDEGDRQLRTTAWRHTFEDRVEELGHWEVRDHDHFEFGYAITAHKAQGSQWESVLVWDESWVFRSKRREWLYTAITRAARDVVVVKT